MSETYTRMYTVIRGLSKKDDVIVLNRRFTREEIRATLEEEPKEYSEEWIDTVVKKGIYINEGETLIIECKEEEKDIRSAFKPYRSGFSCAYIHRRDKVEVYPNSTFKVIYYYSILDKIEVFLSNKLEQIKNLFEKNR